MEPTTLLLSYTPLAVAALLPVFVIWDATIRRNSRRSWPALLQILLGALMFPAAAGAVWISVTTLASYTAIQNATQDALLVFFGGCYAILAIACIGTLIVGLVKPARPIPRRGLTIVVLVTDVILAVVGGTYAFPQLAAALETLTGA